MRIVIIYIPFFLSLSQALHTPSRQRTHINLTDYTRAHSYSPSYAFSRLDGWDNVLISDLPYKYRLDNSIDDAYKTHNRLERRSRKAKGEGLGDAVQHAIDATFKGIGNIVSVTITWYTGNDLKNPSCWKNPGWAPSDESFACAVTLEGWSNRPRCFQFVELCNGTKKCIFVRVVDTCAGCSKGSKHVDLTKAAFQKLAPLEQGTLQVNMRIATEPHIWSVNLWGPKTV